MSITTALPSIAVWLALAVGCSSSSTNDTSASGGTAGGGSGGVGGASGDSGAGEKDASTSDAANDALVDAEAEAAPCPETPYGCLEATAACANPCHETWWTCDEVCADAPCRTACESSQENCQIACKTDCSNCAANAGSCTATKDCASKLWCGDHNCDE